MDNTAEILSVIKSLTSAMQGMLEAMQYIQNAVQLIEDKVTTLEEHDYSHSELEKLLIDMGFRND